MSQNVKAAIELLNTELELSQLASESYQRDLSSKISLSLLTMASFSNKASEIGLGINAAIILTYLLENTSATAKEVDRLLGRKKSSMRDYFKANSVSLADTYIKKTGSPKDARIKIYTLTPAGISAASKLKSILD